MNRFKMNAVLDAAVERAKLGITDRRSAARWRVDGIPRHFQFEGVDMLVTVQDEAGKIDLNSSDKSMLSRLLESGGLERDAASSLAGRIIDWRIISISDQARVQMDDEYVKAGYTYHPRHGLFQSVDELQLVMGMSPTLFAKIRPALTIFSKRGGPDLAVAPPLVLKAVYLNDEKVRSIMNQRNSAVGQYAGPLLVPNYGSVFRSWGHSFDVSVNARQFGQMFSRDAVMIVTGDEKKPYIVLAWR